MESSVHPLHPSAMLEPPTELPPLPEGTEALRTVIDLLPQALWLTDAQGCNGYANQAWRSFTGLERTAPVVPAAANDTASDWLQCLHPDDAQGALKSWQQALRAGQPFQGEFRLRHHAGSHRWCWVTAQWQPDALHWFLSATDIHERVLAHQSLADNVGVQKSMLDVSVDCIKTLNPDGTLAHMNRSGCIALGVSSDSGFGQRWLDLLPPEVRSQGQRALHQARQGKSARFAGKSIVAGSTPQYWDNLLTPINGPDGKATSILCVSRDITPLRETEDRLRRVSEQDELTGLPNRRSFNARLKRSLTQARDRGQSVGLMLLDLDHFKHVNDTLGHGAGDHLLRVLSRRLQQCLEGTGFVARLGGDEFAIFVGPIHGEEPLLAVAQQVLAQIHAPITYGGKVINGGMSIGCAMYPRDAQEASSLLKHADTALNDLKAGGRGGVRMFSPHMLRAAREEAEQLERARCIVRQDALVPYYQPKVQLSDGQVVGFEALMRWTHPALGLQLPKTVEAAFKDYELAARIGEMMRDKVFRDLAAWERCGLPVLPVSINAAPVEFLRDDYAERLLAQMNQYGLDSRLVEVEITEHMLGDRGAEYVIRALHLLKQSGVRIALDDFGTGHSSLAHLRDYPVDCLKIDCNFVQSIDKDPTLLAIVKAVGQLGPSLGLDVVAEGVETEAQRELLLGACYPIGQGFLFAAAQDAAQVARLLVQNSGPVARVA